MFTKYDQQQCDNLIKALKKGKYEFDGIEVLAFAEVMKWVSKLNVTIKEDIEKEEARIKEEDEKLREQLANVKATRKSKNGDV